MHAVTEEIQRPQTSSQLSNYQSKEEELRIKSEIVLIVGRAENKCQIHLGTFEREELVDWLFQNKWDRKKMEKALDRLPLLVNECYGKLTPDIWCKAIDEPLYTELELNREVSLRLERYIERRKQEFILMKGNRPTDEQLAERGLINVREYFSKKMYDLLADKTEEIETQCKKLKAQFHNLPDQAKIDLWQKAVAKGLVKDGDINAMQVLPFLVAEMIPEFQEAILNNVQREVVVKSWASDLDDQSTM